MQCVVLAGGLGTRMHPLTLTLPKALIPVCGKPFIDHQLRWLFAHGVTEVVLSLGHLGELVEEHVASHSELGPVRYVHEGSELRGTGGALRKARDSGALEDDFLVIYGDSYLPVDFGAVGRAFRQSGRPAMMTVFENDGRWDSSNVVFDADRGMVELYDKWHRHRPSDEFRYIDYGLSALKAEVVDKEIPPERPYDLAELFQNLSLRSELAGFEVTERFYEVGSPAGLSDLETFLSAS